MAEVATINAITELHSARLHADMTLSFCHTSGAIVGAGAVILPVAVAVHLCPYPAAGRGRPLGLTLRPPVRKTLCRRLLFPVFSVQRRLRFRFHPPCLSPASSISLPNARLPTGKDPKRMVVARTRGLCLHSAPRCRRISAEEPLPRLSRLRRLDIHRHLVRRSPPSASVRAAHSPVPRNRGLDLISGRPVHVS